ncbi:MAG: alpha/beta fold hydrolase [Chloroflexota bacterium]
MKKQLRGIKRTTFLYDFDLYRVKVPLHNAPKHALSVIDMIPKDATQTIVFVHGYAGAAESFEHQINHFVSNFRVVVPDLRGHGQSDAPYTQYDMPEIIADLETLVEHLKLPEQFILVGHSFGGSICVEYANKYPERVDKLILIASAGEYPLPKAVKYFSRIPTRPFRPLWRYRPRWDAELHVMKRMAFNNLLIWQGWNLLRNLQVDTLVLTGERDNLFPRYAFDDVGNMIPNAQVYDVGASKHQVQLERYQAVNRAIEGFIQEKRSSWRDQKQGQGDSQPWLRNYSENTPASIPIPERPFHHFLESAADWRPKNTAIVFYGQTLTYEQLNRKVNQLAHGLLEMGIEQGDRLMLVLPNCPQMVIAYYAIMKIGAVAVLPNPDADAQRIAHQLTITQAKVLITLTAYHELASTLKGAGVQSVIFVDIRHTLEESVYKRILQDVVDDLRENPTQDVGTLMDTLIANQASHNPDIDVPYDALANINFTSGTTDLPKGVCLTHHNLVANSLQNRHWIPDLKYGDETILCALPFLHSYGLTTGMNVPVTIAARMVLLSVFDLQQVLEHIKKYKPTLMPGVPSMYTAINQAPNVRSYGLSSIKACISGAAPLPIEVQEAFEKLTRGRLVEGYGLTEASPATHANPLYGLRKVGSIGIPMPNTDAKIVDLVTGDVLPAGQIGELAVKGPQVMTGYWGTDHEDEAESILRDGWLYTGDVAVMDHDGYFRIISRKRDTIMTGTYSVYPRDVEEVLYENNKVLEAAVVGVGQEDGEQKIKAFVVPRPNTTLTKEELIALCKRRLDEYAVPWEIEFREILPKSFVGKVLRRLLVEDKSDPS